MGSCICGNLRTKSSALVQSTMESESPTKRIFNFLWKVSNCLAIAKNLAERRSTKESSCCQRSEEEEETVNRLLSQCPFARVVWAASPLVFLCSISILTYQSTQIHLLEVINNGIRSRLHCFSWFLWRILKERNAICFSGSKLSSLQVVQVWDLGASFLPANRRGMRIPRPTHIPKWYLPFSGTTYKCNFDASSYIS